jgi:epsin
MLDKRLNDKGKNWRHVLKALKVLDYILHEGSELVVTWAVKNIYIIKTLREFQYIDEDGRDVGQNGKHPRRKWVNYSNQISSPCVC